MEEPAIRIVDVAFGTIDGLRVAETLRKAGIIPHSIPTTIHSDSIIYDSKIAFHSIEGAEQLARTYNPSQSQT